ncbi:unnamed protein product [Didymodactylos carnosus]|uniref:Uncharacterized protein n=1 Tax=Didymodactylos carnosus TaxID=1234261 RepID=A0A814LU32_9BILA|nr:unnamed protein product [Didymodactylos carnosus]CAF3837488.1 unnamed protein product [Didymodactylos carnosus]
MSSSFNTPLLPSYYVPKYDAANSTTTSSPSLSSTITGTNYHHLPLFNIRSSPSSFTSDYSPRTLSCLQQQLNDLNSSSTRTTTTSSMTYCTNNYCPNCASIFSSKIDNPIRQFSNHNRTTIETPCRFSSKLAKYPRLSNEINDPSILSKTKTNCLSK